MMERTIQCMVLGVSLMMFAACRQSARSDSAPLADTAARASSPATASQTAPVSAALDGRIFSLEVTEPGKPAEPDEMTFNAGRIHSKGCDQYGFGDATYTAMATGDAISFTAETMSPKEGRIAWSGTVTGESVAGRMVWTKEGQAAIEYTYTGRQKK